MADSQNSSPTIVAPITAHTSPQRCALRLSGSKTKEILEKLLSHELDFSYKAHSLSIDLKLSTDFTVKLKILLLTMPEKCSYTFEQVAEIHFPANEKVTTALLETLYHLGAKPAEPGEFTRRAFHNGRINLAQAGSVSALIAASNLDEREQALKVMASDHGDQLSELKEMLFTFRRNLEAVIDFPEEPDVAENTFRWQKEIENLENATAKVEEQHGQFKIQSQFKILIMGPANAGKSSLIQALIPESLPVVSQVPGTTLDLVPYPITINDQHALLYDSPGLKEVENVLDDISQKKFHQRLPSFDAYLLVSAIDTEEPEWPDIPESRPCLKLKSKIDLLDSGANPQDSFSSLNGEGLGQIQTKIYQWCIEQRSPVSPWQALEQKTVHLIKNRCESIKSLLLNEENSEELAAYELDELLDELNALIHQEGGYEVLLDSIFKDFCIGK